MYGEYFDGRRCAEFCLASFKSMSAVEMPDCNDPDSVDQFLKASSSDVYLKPLSQALVSGQSRSKYSSGMQNHPNNVYKTSGSRNSGGWKKRIFDDSLQQPAADLKDIKPRWYFV